MEASRIRRTAKNLLAQSQPSSRQTWRIAPRKFYGARRQPYNRAHDRSADHPLAHPVPARPRRAAARDHARLHQRHRQLPRRPHSPRNNRRHAAPLRQTRRRHRRPGTRHPPADPRARETDPRPALHLHPAHPCTRAAPRKTAPSDHRPPQPHGRAVPQPRTPRAETRRTHAARAGREPPPSCAFGAIHLPHAPHGGGKAPRSCLPQCAALGEVDRRVFAPRRRGPLRATARASAQLMSENRNALPRKPSFRERPRAS